MRAPPRQHARTPRQHARTPRQHARTPRQHARTPPAARAHPYAAAAGRCAAALDRGASPDGTSARHARGSAKPDGGHAPPRKEADSLHRRSASHLIPTAGDDSARALALTADGVVVAGSVTGALEGTHQGGEDIFVQKLGADGTVAWTRQFGTAADEGEPLALAVAGDGAVVVASTTAGDLGTGSAGGVDALVRTYEPDGTLRGSTQFGTPSTDVGTGVAIASDGALFVCGATEGDLEGTTAGGWDAFVTRTEL